MRIFGLFLCVSLLHSVKGCKNGRKGDLDDNETTNKSVVLVVEEESFEISSPIIMRDTPTDETITSRVQRSVTRSGVSWRDPDKDVLINYFTDCIQGTGILGYDMVSMYVNFVINHDVWFPATNSMCKSDQDISDCWRNNAQYLLESSSIYFHPFKSCLNKYLNDDNPTIHVNLKHRSVKRKVCKPPPIIYRLNNEYPVSCESTYDFAMCMTSEQEQYYYCDYFGDKRKYDFNTLQTFVVNDRKDCRFLKRDGEQYDVKCRPQSNERTPTWPVFQYFYNEETGYYNNEDYYGGLNQFTYYGPEATWQQYMWRPRSYRNLRPPFRPPPMQHECFAGKMKDILSSTSYMHNVLRRCTNRAHTYDYKFKDTIGQCSPGCGWTNWFDMTRPTRNNGNDNETLENYKNIYKRSYSRLGICKYPTAIQARTTNGRSYSTTKDFIKISPTYGLSCQNTKSESCENYRIRFCCPGGESKR